jgi:hypothetical protein
VSIRIRESNGMTIALCACETDPMPGDVYLDDSQHYALAAKFAQDADPAGDPWPEWAEMERHKVRDAEATHDAWVADKLAEGMN